MKNVSFEGASGFRFLAWMDGRMDGKLIRKKKHQR